VKSGHAVILRPDGVRQKRYWKPESLPTFQNRSDEEYQAEFIRLFDTCVSCVMRSSRRTGILLSGGLDSTSVACFAAPILQEKKEKLYSYTSVPEKDYITREKPQYITDEYKQVEITRAYLGNLCCTYLNLPGVNGFDGATDYMHQLELPYKSLQNIRWIQEAADTAAKDGCRILLTGQYGNSTISFGKYRVHFYSLLRGGRLRLLYREVRAYCQRYHKSKKKVWIKIISDATWKRLRKRLAPKRDPFREVYVNPELLKRYKVKQRFHKKGLNGKEGMVSLKQYRPLMVSEYAFMQIGEIETRLSLINGVLLRDPTRDKRLIEFCMRLPEEQFVHNGIERRLVREYLSAYLPEEIIGNCSQRGMQSADTRERIAKNWSSIKNECEALLQEEIAGKLLDVPKVKQNLQIDQEKLIEMDSFVLLKLLYSLLLVKYVKKEESQTENKMKK